MLRQNPPCDNYKHKLQMVYNRYVLSRGQATANTIVIQLFVTARHGVTLTTLRNTVQFQLNTPLKLLFSTQTFAICSLGTALYIQCATHCEWHCIVNTRQRIVFLVTTRFDNFLSRKILKTIIQCIQAFKIQDDCS